MFKRCIAVLLMAAMLMGVVPTAVHAAPVYYNEEIHTDFGELLYNLDDDAFWLMVYGYVQLDDKSAWYFAFLFQHPDFYSLLQAYKGYVAMLNNPVFWRDPTGLKVWAIHGTWGTGEGHFPNEFLDYLRVFFGQEVEHGNWLGGNNAADRHQGMLDLVSDIRSWWDAGGETSGSPIRLIGYSHGGNIAIMAANRLSQMYGIPVETLITFGTPVRSDYQLARGVTVGQHINVFNLADPIQLAGGIINWNRGLLGIPIPMLTPAGRTFENARNVRVGRFNLVTAHGSMHNNADVWRTHISPLFPGLTFPAAPSPRQRLPLPAIGVPIPIPTPVPMPAPPPPRR